MIECKRYFACSRSDVLNLDPHGMSGVFDNDFASRRNGARVLECERSDGEVGSGSG